MSGGVSRLHKIHPKVQKLYDKGIKSVIPLLSGKAPGYGAWQKLTDEEAQEKIWAWSESHGGGDSNFGIRLGRGFGDIVDIDLDSAESRVLAKYYLSDTARFGRGGEVTHYIFRSAVKSSRRFQWDKRDEKSVLLELRASGQTMGPGSVHPVTGETVEWYGEDEILSVDPEDLERRVRELAAASLLLRDWQGGARDEMSVCLVGSMIRSGWEDDEIDDFLQGVVVESGDEEGEKRLKSERLREVLADGGRVPGLKRLRELCVEGGLFGGRGGFDSLVDWLGLGAGDIVEQLNAEFAVVANGGSVMILQEKAGGSGGVNFLSRSDFSLLMSNRRVSVGDREVTADKFWLGHQDRREYPGGVVFKPEQKEGAGEYNLWRGFTVDEIEGEFGVGWDLFYDHLWVSVCGRRQDLMDYLLGWMAHRVQRPWEVPGSAVVLVGRPGCGKSLVFRLLGDLFGEHYMSVTQGDHLAGKFNFHLSNKCLVLADEATWGGDKVREGVLKTIITEKTKMVEMKGRDSFAVANCIGLGICSNHDWVVPIDSGDRRYMVLAVGPERIGDYAYWDALVEQMSAEGGGLGRLLYDLRRWDLVGKGWQAARIPWTEARGEQMEQGVSSVTQFLLDWGSEGVWSEDGGHIELNRLYDEYVSWSGRGRVERRLHFKRQLEKVLVPGASRRVKRGDGGKVAMVEFDEGWLNRLRRHLGMRVIDAKNE